MATDRSESRRRWSAAKRAENPEEYLRRAAKCTQKWRERNPEKAKASRDRANNSEKGEARRKRYMEKHPDRRFVTHRKSSLKRRYNLTIDQWEAIFAAQGSACANRACATGPDGKYWHTDHCHKTRKLRGILCKACNNALGMANDSPESLRGLADYLESHAKGII